MQILEKGLANMKMDGKRNSQTTEGGRRKVDLLNKKCKLLEESKDGQACDLIKYIVKKANHENKKQIIETLMKYANKGYVEHLRGFAVARMVDLISENEVSYSDFFETCIESKDENKIYWGIEGYIKIRGISSCDFLIPFVFCNDFPLSCKANIIKKLSRITNNTFDQGKPMDPGNWKESDINYEEIRQWTENRFPFGKGYEEPVRHICLEVPETFAEKIYSKLDKKLAKKRAKKQDLANPTNWLVMANEADIIRIRNKWKLPEYYMDFLSKASPLKADLKLKNYGRINVYGAYNLIENQNGYSFNPITGEEIDNWNKNYLVIAERNADPFCIDISLKNSPIYFAHHGMGEWKYEEAFVDFITFLNQIII